jgi:16S rRNA (guanine1516-N2)-methyltransferase
MVQISDLKLEWIDHKLSLSDPDQPRLKPFSVDFLTSEFLRRLKEPLSKQLLIKAIGARSKKSHSGFKVLDATAGLGTDSVLCAAAGFHVSAFERSPIVFQLLQDGVERALKAEVEWTSRLQIQNEDSFKYMSAQVQTKKEPMDCVYMDPMYPEAKKAALPRKEMQILRKLLKFESDEVNLKLLEAALAYAGERVVCKRPPSAPFIGGQKPHHSVSGKAVRYDVYLTK